MSYIKISKDFTETPGARYYEDGDFSGQQFRDEHLLPAFEKDDKKITVDLDDTDGYATSFLEEAFGGLARIKGIKAVLDRFDFISTQETSLIEEIKTYINEAND